MYNVTALLKVAGSQIRVKEFVGTEAISRPHKFQIELADATIKLPELLNKRVQLTIQNRELYGAVTCIDGNTLILESSMVLLSFQGGAKVYVNQSIREIIESIFQDINLAIDWSNISGQWHTRIVDFIQQNNFETDYDFVKRLLLDNMADFLTGLNLHGEECIVIFDSSTDLLYKVSTEKIDFIENIQQAANDSDFVGMYNLIHSAQFAKANTLDVFYIFYSNLYKLEPGVKFNLDTSYLKNPSIINITNFLITKVEHSYVRRNGNKPDYEARIKTIGASIKYQSTRQKISKPGKTIAHIEALNSEEKLGKNATLDIAGRYILKFDFDQNNELKYGMRSNWIKRVQFNHGLHLPLYPDSEVLVHYLDNDSSKPVIVNGLHNVINTSVVSALGDFKHALATPMQQQLIFADEKDKSQIIIDNNSSNKIVLDATKDNNKVLISSVKGSTSISSDDNTELEITGDLIAHIDSNLEYTAKSNFKNEAVSGNISWQLKKNMTVASSESILYQCHADYSIVANNIIYSSNMNFNIRASGDICIASANNLLIDTAKDFMMLGDGDGAVEICQAGSDRAGIYIGDSGYISIYANEMLLDCDNISLNGEVISESSVEDVDKTESSAKLLQAKLPDSFDIDRDLIDSIIESQNHSIMVDDMFFNRVSENNYSFEEQKACLIKSLSNHCLIEELSKDGIEFEKSEDTYMEEINVV